MNGLIDLAAMRRGLSPRLLPGEWVCLCLPAESDVPSTALGFLVEDEGRTVLLERSDADQRGLEYEGVFRALRLGVHSALEAVGLTAAISAELAAIGCSANIWAGFHHDLVLVPAPQAEAALACLEAWQAG